MEKVSVSPTALPPTTAATTGSPGYAERYAAVSAGQKVQNDII